MKVFLPLAAADFNEMIGITLLMSKYELIVCYLEINRNFAKNQSIGEQNRRFYFCTKPNNNNQSLISQTIKL